MAAPALFAFDSCQKALRCVICPRSREPIFTTLQFLPKTIVHTKYVLAHSGSGKKKRGICLMFCVSSKRIVYLTMGTRAVLFPQTGRARPYAVVLSRLDLPKHRFDLSMCFSGSLGRVSVSMHVWLRGSSSKY
jgi:hypothetical protein